jgi:hypothetical protein
MAPRAAERHGWRPLLEPVLPLIAGVGSFAVTAVIGRAARARVPEVLFGLLLLVGVAVLARVLGILFALPVGVAAVLAFDWYFLSPLRALDGNTVLVLGTFLIISVLVGEAATRASRRAISSERARGALATEQGALRRVATLVARQSTPGGDAGGGRGVAEEVFAAVAEEIGRRGPPSLAPALASWEARRAGQPEAGARAAVLAGGPASRWAARSEEPVDPADEPRPDPGVDGQRRGMVRGGQPLRLCGASAPRSPS